MHRSWPILLAITALLAGCSSGNSTPATVTVTSPVPAVESPAVTDPNPTNAELFSNQFHPCEVFTEEQFTQAGLGKRTNAGDGEDQIVRSCGFRPTNSSASGATFLVATDQMTKQQIDHLGFEPTDWPSAVSEGIYVHKMPSQVRQCTAAVDFDWGRFLVGYREHGEGWEPTALCSESASILESLLTHIGETHGT